MARRRAAISLAACVLLGLLLPGSHPLRSGVLIRRPRASRVASLPRRSALAFVAAVAGSPWRALAEEEVEEDEQSSVPREAIATLNRAYEAIDRAEPERAEPLLTTCLRAWTDANAPRVEVASLHRLRGSARLQLGRDKEAIADLDKAIALATQDERLDEALQSVQLRALAREQRREWRAARDDLRTLIDNEEVMSASGPNPFLRLRRAKASSALEDYAAAADDLADAEAQLTLIGDRIRAVLARAERALVLYGAGREAESLKTIERVFAEYTKPSSNNPDDLPLLEELSRREAELHLALAAHLGGGAADGATSAGADPRRAADEWAVGCLRLRVYDEQLRARQLDEDRRRLSPTQLERAKWSLAGLTGLAPDSPFVTGLPGEGYWWYRDARSEGAERRSPTDVRGPGERGKGGNGLGCAAYDGEAGAQYARAERGWPPRLVAALRRYRSSVALAAANSVSTMRAE